MRPRSMRLSDRSPRNIQSTWEGQSFLKLYRRSALSRLFQQSQISTAERCTLVVSSGYLKSQSKKDPPIPNCHWTRLSWYRNAHERTIHATRLHQLSFQTSYPCTTRDAPNRDILIAPPLHKCIHLDKGSQPHGEAAASISSCDFTFPRLIRLLCAGLGQSS